MQKTQQIDNYLVTPIKEEYKKISPKYQNVFLSLKINNFDINPLIVFRTIRSKDCFFMQKTHPGDKEPYETIMGHKISETIKITGINPIKKIRKIIRNTKSSTYCDENKHNGLFSYFSYECFQYFDKVPILKKDPNDCPECLVMNPEIISTYNHNEKSIVISKKYESSIENYDKYKDDLVKITKSIIEKTKHLSINSPEKFKGSKSRTITKKNKYLEKIIKIKEKIISGELIQCVLTQRFKKVSKISDQELLEYLSINYPSEYVYQISCNEFSITGSSPEMFLKVKNNIATIRPVAGTIGSIKGKTDSLIKKLKSSIKDKAEHIMLVDLARNDLGKVAIPGSVKVDKLMETMSYRNVIHLVSEVNAKLRKDKDFLDAFSSTFPIGTLVGAPKIRAAELINTIEEEGRGAYCGAIGWFSNDGDLETSTIIRTVIKKGEELSFNGGGGIVFDSIPEVEYQEALDKVKAFW